MAPRCQTYECKNDGVIRASVVMPVETEPSDAVFVRDGVPYGFTYHYCEGCWCLLERAGKTDPLKKWEDQPE